MAMHRQHPDPQFDLSADFAVPALAAANVSHPLAVDVTVCEWTADLSIEPRLVASATLATVAASGFVDFDVIESMHETTGFSIAAEL